MSSPLFKTPVILLYMNTKQARAESFGQRLARIRKERGLTQVELAEKVGTIQAVISAHERDKVRLHADLLAKVAKTLRVSADDLLGLNGNGDIDERPSLKFLRRIQKIESLPDHQQRALIQTIDNYLKGAGVKA